MHGRPPIRLLIFLREPFPTSRVDVAVLFSRLLRQRGHKVDFVMQAADASQEPGKHQWFDNTVWVGPTDAGDGLHHRLRKHLLAFMHDIACLRYGRKADYDAIQVRDKYLIAAIAVVIARMRGIKFFFWLSWPEAESQLARAREGSARYPVLGYLRGRVYGLLLYRWILPLSHHVFVQSQRMKEDVTARGIRAEKLTPVPMGVEMADLPASKTDYVVRRGDVLIGYLGVLSAERKLEVLVDMLAALRARGMNARLLVVGDGEHPRHRQAIERRAQQLGVAQWIEITGFLPRSDALARLLAADVCVSPFFPTPVLRSTSPTKLVEYLALGIPIVANDHPEQRRVLRESRAGLCVPWGPRHFARAVVWLMARSPDERRAMAARGRSWVESHRTYARLCDLVEQTYLDVLRPPAGTTTQ